MRVLITDSDNRSALAATRSLGRAGHHVITAGERARSIAAASKYSAHFVQCPSALRDPDGFLHTIVEAASRHAIDLLLPMTEVTTLLLTEHRAQLPPSCALPFASDATLSRASDKAGVLALAQQLGVPTPRTTVLRSPDDLELAISKLGWPTVVKPARSRVRRADGWLSTSVSYAQDADELRARIAKTPPEAFPLLLQERIHGPGVGFFACYAQGKPIAYFAHKRLREKPPSGGVSVLRESTAIADDALQHGSRLLEALNWHGVAMVEFKRDLRDGSLRLMEINARFWGSLQLAIDAGVDFPSILADIARGEVPAPQPPHRVGVRSRWLLGDLDVLLMVLTRRRSTLNLPPGFPSRLQLLRDFFWFWRKDELDEVFRRDDPRPALIELRRWLLG